MEDAGISPYTQFIEAHFQYRRAAEIDSGHAEYKIREQSIADMKAIEKAFPGLRSGNLVLSMAAWFSLLCTVDDIVEQMDREEAQDSMKQSTEMLMGSE